MIRKLLCQHSLLSCSARLYREWRLGLRQVAESVNRLVFGKVWLKNICWSCIFPMRIMGVGSSPEGAAPSQPVCYCTDQNGVPEVGWQLSFFQPVKIVEVVQSPWCSPFLEGVSLQSSSFDMGKGATNRPKGGNEAGFYDVHLWGVSDLVMLKLPSLWGIVPLSLYIDPSLTYIDEVDPLWENDLLTLVLNPEAVVFRKSYCFNVVRGWSVKGYSWGYNWVPILCRLWW